MTISEPELQIRKSVEMLYDSLKHGDNETVAKPLLTGESLDLEFKFEPRNITVIDDRVIVEGWEGNEAYWVHVWTVNVQDGLITQFREYFNTWITVRDLRMSKSVWGQIKQIKPTIWKSEPQEHLNRSLPGLVLAI
ncbi:hypothetical protein MKW98_020765 [Papaver atlanticum]|uniref:Wound-induced protein 1 n=1 Tax=Papaver atlanticum TaxID=357466 RepID=A0AAD4TFD6_9MAGN|nr:hypothetical protein MKW98_020765 [Papaver atlanticum]